MVELGRKLKEIRESKGYSLDDIYKSTRLNKEYLQKLETGITDFLPNVYIKSFIKSYCEFLEIDPKEFLTRVDEITNLNKKNSAKEKTFVDLEKKDIVQNQNQVINKPFIQARPVKINLLVIFILIILVALIIIFFPKIKSFFLSEDKSINTTQIQENRFVEKKSNSIQENISTTDSLNLEIRADDKVWIQVLADKKIIEAKNFTKDEIKKYTTKNEFELLIGSMGNVKLYQNGKQVPITGSIGLVRRLKITASGFEILTTPQKTVDTSGRIRR